ncbi:hypothetical protein NRB_26960 [Novosphingobium sp. 11B]
MAEALCGQVKDTRIGLEQFLVARDDDVSEQVEQRLSGAVFMPERASEVGDGEERHAARSQFAYDLVAAGDVAGDRLAEARGVGVEQVVVPGKFGLAGGDHLGEVAAAVVLDVPVLRDDVGHEPVEPVGLDDQLAEQQAHVPLDQHLADVEDDSINSTDSRHDKTPAIGGGLMHATKPSACYRPPKRADRISPGGP